jgi:hypothetical protein
VPAPAELHQQPSAGDPNMLPKLAVAAQLRAAVLPSFGPTDLHRAARPRITLHDRAIWTPDDQGEYNSGEPCRTDLNARHPAENRKVGGSIPSLPVQMAFRLRYGQRQVNDRPSTGSGAVTIRKRRDGWQVIVYAALDPLTGKQRQLTRQVNGSYRQAEKVEGRLRTEVADGQHAGTRLKTLGELVDLWIERRAASDKPISPDTVEDYRGLIAKKIKPALGSKRLHTINARVLDVFYDDLQRFGNAKATPAPEPAPRPRRSPGARTRARLLARRSPPLATSG